MLLAIFLLTAGYMPLLFLYEDTRWLIYPLQIFAGSGLVIMLNSSISLISDVLGNDAENAATIYGIYSFFEKIVNGLAVERVVNLYTTPETTN